MFVTFLIIVVKGIVQMKILLVAFNHYCKRYHSNENIACYFFKRTPQDGCSCWYVLYRNWPQE